jgi:ribosomal protein S12 methylthiotransferase accessory factor
MFEKNTKAYWDIQRLRKYSGKGVERSVHPRVTVARANRVLKEVGITRVAEVTDLDRLGIPNFMTVRPRDLGPGISYYNGKGTTRMDAHAGALMEAVERHAGEYCRYPIIVGSYDDLKSSYSCVDPEEIIVPRVGEYTSDLVLEWAAGYDLLNERETLVPLNSVICPYRPRTGSMLFYASSNGLASGNTLTEALGHALCEIIERDAQAISMARLQLGPMARALLGVSENASGIGSMHRQISFERLPARANTLIKKIQRAGLTVVVRDLTATTGIATIDCAIIGDGQDGFGQAHGGCGTHPDARVALIRALTEAAQSRVTCIQGGREDLPDIVKQKPPYNPRPFNDSTIEVRFGDIPTVENEYIDDDIRLLLDRLPASGIGQVIAFDMTHPAVGIPVVRVVVPRAEAWTVFHLHTGRGLFGRRISEQLVNHA